MGRGVISISLKYFVSHPIQYQAPLLRRIAAEPGIRLRVVFENMDTAQTYYDPGFGHSVTWDVPLTDGYEHVPISNTSIDAELADADVIWLHGWQSTTLRRVLRVAHRRQIPVLMRGENCEMAMPDGSGLRGWLKRRYINWIIRRCSAFLCIGTANRAYYLHRGVSPDRLFMMPYAIDNDTFAARADASDEAVQLLRDRLEIADARKVILFAAKLMPRKRADLLIQSTQLLSTDEDAPILVVVGDGVCRSELQSSAPNARFTGFVNQSELPVYYRMADVFVLPSEREPWGLAVNEAMACGTSVVVSDEVGCGPDLVNDTTGRTFPAGDANALAAAICECLENSEILGANARTHILDWGYTADIYGLKAALNWVREHA